MVNQDIPDFALVIGARARLVGWMSEAGKKLQFDKKGLVFCEKCRKRYRLEHGTVHELE